MIFTLFPDYFSRQAKRRQARKEIKTKWRQTLPQGEKRKRGKRHFQSAPLLLSYKKYYHTKLFCRNPTWVAEILVSSVLYGKVATIGCRVCPKLS